MFMKAENKSLYTTSIEVAKFIRGNKEIVDVEIQKIINILLQAGEKVENFYIVANDGYFISIDGVRLLPFGVDQRIKVETMIKDVEANEVPRVEAEIVEDKIETLHNNYKLVSIGEYQPIDVIEELRKEIGMSVSAEELASVFSRGNIVKKSKEEHLKKATDSLLNKYNNKINTINEVLERCSKYEQLNRKLVTLGSELRIVEENIADEDNIKASATLIGSGVLIDVGYMEHIWIEGKYIYLDNGYYTNTVDIYSEGAIIDTQASVFDNKINLFIDRYNGLEKKYESSDWIDVRSIDEKIDYCIEVEIFVNYLSGKFKDIATIEQLKQLRFRYEKALKDLNGLI